METSAEGWDHPREMGMGLGTTLRRWAQGWHHPGDRGMGLGTNTGRWAQGWDRPGDTGTMGTGDQAPYGEMGIVTMTEMSHWVPS